MTLPPNLPHTNRSVANSPPFTASMYNITRSNNSVATLTSSESVTDLGQVALAIFLVTLTLMTIFGNCLVVVAVVRKKYLQNPTGYFIISMAVADLVVGILVMPFAVMVEVTHEKSWPLGLAFCDIWHCLDILASTASIWNLSVISLDRYFAITAPLQYWDKITNTRAVTAIIGVWVCSMLISFPAIWWWRWATPHLYQDPGVYLFEACSMTTDPSYVIPASVVAYYIPLLVTLFAYSRIFLIASTHETSLKSGQKTAHANGKDGKGVEMRIHRGGGNAMPDVEEEENANPVLKRSGRREAEMIIRFQKRLIAISVSDSESEEELEQDSDDDDDVEFDAEEMHKFLTRKKEKPQKTRKTLAPASPAPLSKTPQPNNSSLLAQHSAPSKYSSTGNSGPQSSSPNENSPLLISDPPSNSDQTRRGSLKPSSFRRNSSFKSTLVDTSNNLMPYPANEKIRKKANKKKSKIFSKFTQEKRAAKTLGIVVGCFIVCWLPFFVTNIILTACASCILNPILTMTTVSWLGYCNSALNPLIYGVFNRQFQRAFSEILGCSDDAKEIARSSVLRYAITQGAVPSGKNKNRNETNV